MLNILHGRAGTGKTGHIMLDIKHRMAEGETGMLLIVPEQYSHDAERKLCAVCGDSLPLHAEVLSFTSLCRHVLSETGTASAGNAGGPQSKTLRVLDKSGQILVMHKALEAVGPNLKVFGIRKTRTEMLESLLAAVREFKSMCVTPDRLEKLASKAISPLSDKLRDFALIMDAYDALLVTYGGDAAERLDLLAIKIGEGSVSVPGHIYFDGFNDFTAQEMRIIKEFVKTGADLTVCLTCDLEGDAADSGKAEIFQLPRRTIAGLCRMPAKIKYTCIKEGHENAQNTRVPELAFLEKHLFSDNPGKYSPPSGRSSGASSGSRGPDLRTQPHSPMITDPITILAAPSKFTECEYAACAVWDMVRSGYRWREIGIMARDFSQYESICEQIFEKYGIPYFSSGKADIRSKPPIALIDAALEIASSGWEYIAVGRYLKTGLLQLSFDEVAMLENYVIKWNIRGSMWTRKWVMPPSGYRTGRSSEKEKKADESLLVQLNILREKVAAPLEKLRKGIKGQTPVEVKLRALYEFISEIGFDGQLLKKADDFAQRGQLRFAGEYTQLLNIIIDAMDQACEVLGKTVQSETEFRKLIILVLSQHDVGVIPIKLDAVPLGTMAMSRRRDLKCLIILGATDENMPMLGQSRGVLSDNERAELAALDDNIVSGFEERLYREMNIIYSSLTLPSDKLVLIYHKAGGTHPSFVIKRLRDMFGLCERSLSEEQYMGAAEIPYLELQDIRAHADESAERQYLTPLTAENLYGRNLALSATRADRFYSCAYRHYLQSGLRLSPRRAAQFDAASAGDFMHSVLEGVFGEIKADIGFENVDDMALGSLATKYIEKYVADTLLGFEGKNARFEYLFRRYGQNVQYVLRDMAEELKNSKFVPAEFEFDLSGLSKTQRGFIDRVDAYKEGDKLYLRVIDYKTRRKAYGFELCDVFHGRDMQMLIYLFALQRHGKEKFGIPPEPAGVLYIPARDVYVSAARNATDEEVGKIRERDMRRSGLVLSDPAIVEAMECGEHKKFLPVKKTKDGNFAGDSLVSKKRLEILAKHVETKMNRAREEILGGANACRPYYKNTYDNACMYCEYFAVCGFDEQMGDKRRYAGKMKAEEVWEALEKEVKTG